ncbi:hypothetical protein NRB_42890 [Novosphingobium sp. 11B]
MDSGVATPPGLTALTRMPSGPNSSAAVCVAEMIAALLIPYSPQPGVPLAPDSEATLTIAPPRSIRRAASRMPTSTLSALIR